MIKTSISDLKTNLSDYLRQVEQDQVIEVCRHRRVVAEIRKVESDHVSHNVRRELGVGQRLFGERLVADDAFAPLPAEDLGGLGSFGVYQDEV